MNEIKIYLKPSGSTAELYKDFNLYQGSYRNVQITIYVPTAILYKNADDTFYNTVETGAILTAPNGAKVPTKGFFAQFVKTAIVNNVEYAEYTQVMPKEFAMYAGAQLIVCNVVSIDNTDESAPKIVSVTASQRAPLIVQESAYLADDQPLEPSEAEVIKGLINTLQERLNEGAFASRAIYPWDVKYAYGLDELVFYPFKGEYGVFLKSLKDDNKNEPYIDGVLDTDSWLLVSDFNILTELYTLKTDMIEAVEETKAQAQSAEQSASNALNSQNKAEQSATNAENSAQRIEAEAQYLEGIKDGTLSVPKAVADETGNNIANQFEEITEKIPSTASAENQLADKAFVNSSINNMAAFYITSNAQGDAFATRADLLSATIFYSGGQERVPTQNDYAIVLADESQPEGVDGTHPTTRYSYQGGTYPNGQWDFQYVVNNTSLTQAQVDAINSGITAELVDQIGAENVLPIRNLYNLGAFNTYVSNSNSMGTVTRKTGYGVLDGTESWIEIGNDYLTNKFMHKAQPNVEVVSTALLIGTETGTYNMRVFNAKLAYGSIDRFKQYLASMPVFIQYELASEYQYTEQVIENQPIRPANQEECLYWHEEWRKGLNLYKGQQSFNDGFNDLTAEGELPVGTYTIIIRTTSKQGNQLIGGGITQNDNVFVEANIPTIFTTTTTEPLTIYINDASRITSLMLTRGVIPYPYEPYNGKIVRENQLNNFVNKTGDTMTGELTLSTGQSARGFKNGNLRFGYNSDYATGFYTGAFEDYDKCFVCGDGGDKAVIQYSYSNGWYFRVSNNGSETQNTRLMDAVGHLLDLGERVYSPNNKPPIVDTAINNTVLDGSNVTLIPVPVGQMGFRTFSTTSTSISTIKLPSSGNYYYIFTINNSYYNGTIDSYSNSNSGYASGGTQIAQIQGNGKRTHIAIIYYRVS